MKNASLFQLLNSVTKELNRKQEMVAVAESCTGGMLAQYFTQLSGSSNWFDCGFITYSNQSKQNLLNVPEKLINEFGAVSQEVAQAMVRGVLQKSSAKYALSITGIAGPEGGTEYKPVGTVFIGFGTEEQIFSEKFHFDGDREHIRFLSVESAMLVIARFLGLIS